MVPQIGHAQSVDRILFTSDGRRIVTAAGDNLAKIWTSDGRLIRTLSIGMHRAIAISPDDRYLAVATFGSRVALWTLAGKKLGVFPKMDAQIVGAVEFTPDGRALFACTTMSKTDHCSEFPLDGSPGIRFDDPYGTSNVRSIGFAADGSIVYIAGAQHVHRYRRDGTPLEPFRVSEGYVDAMAISPDGTLIATGDSRTSRDGSTPHTRLWTNDGELIAEVAGHPSTSLVFTGDSEWLLAGSPTANRVLRIHRSGRTNGFPVGRTSNDTPSRIGVSPDGTLIVSSGRAIDPVEIRRWSSSGESLGTFRQTNNVVTALDFHSDAGLIVTVSVDDMIRYWSVDGRLVRAHHAGYSKPNLLAIAPNGRAFVTGGTELTVWNDDAEPIARAKLHRKAARDLRFSADTRYLISGGLDGDVVMTAVAEGAESKRFEAHDGEDLHSIAVHPDGRHFATGTSMMRFRIWDVDGTRLADHPTPEGSKPPFSSLDEMEFTPDGESLVVLTRRPGEEIRFHAMDGSLQRTAGFPSRSRFHNEVMTVSPDGRFVAASVNHDIVLWKHDTLEIVRTLSGHSSWIAEIEFSDDGEQLVSAGTNGVLRIWNTATGDSYAMVAEGDEWAIWTDDGYFDASRSGGDLVAMVANDRVYGVDQFAAVYNRPDVMFERIGLASPIVIEHFRAYHRRRASSRGGQQAGTGAAPTVRITEQTRDGEQLRLKLDTAVPGDTRALLQVFANGVPLYRPPGIPVDAGRGERTIEVALAGGRNKIEVGVETATGVRSLRETVFVERPPATGDLYYVGFGVSRYADPALNLNYAAKDVADLGDALEALPGAFGAVHRLELTDERATRAGLAQAARFLADAGVNDTVVLLVSGHGAYETRGVPTYFFLPHDVATDDLAGSGISFDELEALTAETQARRRLVLLDTCQSGEYDETTLRAAAALADEQGLSLRARTKLLSDAASERPPYVYRRDRYIYNDVSRRSGAVVFSSSLADEASLEASALENGVFTYAIVHALGDPATDDDGDGTVSLVELERAVKLAVVTLTGGLQHPTIERENIDQAFGFRRGQIYFSPSGGK